MLFLLALPVVSCVALLWRYLQIYAPSNMLMRHVRSAPPRWRTVLFLLALAVVLLVAMHVVSEAVGRGAPGWFNLVVIVLGWDGVKMASLAVIELLHCLAVHGLAQCVKSADQRRRFAAGDVVGGSRSVGPVDVGEVGGDSEVSCENASSVRGTVWLSTIRSPQHAVPTLAQPKIR